jgi:hypothetical protein
VSQRTGTRDSDPADPPPTAPDGQYLVVRLVEDGRDASRYLLTIWLVHADNRWDVRYTPDAAQPVEAIVARFDQELHRLAFDTTVTVEIEDLAVEFILPQSVLAAAVDQWLVNAPGYTNPIGVHYPVAVRDLLRMRNRLIRPRWRRRCANLREHGHTNSGAHFHYLNGRTVDGFAEVLQDPQKTCVIVVGGAGDDVLPSINAWLSAGIPAIVWCREGSSATRFAHHMRDVVNEGGVAGLRAAVWHLRQDAATSDASPNHVGRHISLLWDDVERIPPDDQQPLVGPSTVN